MALLRSFSVLGASAVFLAGCASPVQNGAVVPEDGGTTEVETSQGADGAMGQDGGAAAAKAAVKVAVDVAPVTIDVVADNWLFTPSTIRAKKGQSVTLRVTAKAGTHSFTSQDLGINVPVTAGETKTVTLPTDKTGTFSFACRIPCGSGHKDMKGTIVID
ncbi:MAG: cytochrome c oxidase subunit II [Candidatus Peregrinibacteria bacterium Gr01-1014_25]|nr:MAG: cytochrome c oxidase subunit II [Candidatus Peregrinibacteria bacterium Gr01-1014_25]